MECLMEEVVEMACLMEEALGDSLKTCRSAEACGRGIWHAPVGMFWGLSPPPPPVLTDGVYGCRRE